MHLSDGGRGGRYKSAAVSYREHGQTVNDTLYLGLCLDREKGIFKNKERGVFTFDLCSGEFGEVGEDFVFPRSLKDGRRKSTAQVDFGDAFFVNAFLYKCGFMDVVDSIGFKNKDTLHVMVLFYILSNLANCHAIKWYDGSFAKYLYPDANMISPRISYFLSSIGSPERIQTFHNTYINFVLTHCSPDTNILVDSTGLENSIHFPLTRMSVHNNKASLEIRLIFVVQKHFGVPLFFQEIAGNIVDVSTLKRTLLHIKCHGIDIESCIMDAGYYCSDNIDIFYDEHHNCIIGFVTRIKSNDIEFKRILNEELKDLQNPKNVVIYEDRVLFIKKRQIMVGKNRDNPAWLYIGIDLMRDGDEKKKLVRKAIQKKLSFEDICNAIEKHGLFGLISGVEYTNQEILPVYYQRQTAEQLFDIVKNYTKMLPLRISTIETLRGHLLLSYIATCAIRLIQLKLKTTDLFSSGVLKELNNQKCIIYPQRIVTGTPQAKANEAYGVCGVKCSEEIQLESGKALYIPPEIEKNYFGINENSHPSREGRPAASPASMDTAREKERREGASEEPPKRKRGRPKGSKNKSTLEREAREAEEGVKEEAPRRKPGRPKGSKNKSTLEKEAQSQAEMNANTRRGPGRPKGSKNKRTLEREAREEAARQAGTQVSPV